MNSIFEQSWWISAATSDAFQRVRFSDGESLSAEMILVPRNKWRLKCLAMPHLARVWSPKIEFGSVKPKNRLSAQVKALTGLMAQLPACDHLSYTLPPESDLVLAHTLAGFEVTPAYTFRSDPDRDVMAFMDQKIRYNIRSGRKRITIVHHGNIERYIALSQAFIRDRSLQDYNNYATIRRIYAAACARDQALIVSALDQAGRECASAVLLCDDTTLYYWLNCRDPSVNDYAANSTLIWEAIQIAAARRLQFDTDGYLTANGGAFFSRFGLVPTARHAVRHTSRRYAVCKAQHDLLRAFVGTGIRETILAARNRLPLKSGAGLGLFRRTARSVATVS